MRCYFGDETIDTADAVVGKSLVLEDLLYEGSYPYSVAIRTWAYNTSFVYFSINSWLRYIIGATSYVVHRALSDWQILI